MNKLNEILLSRNKKCYKGKLIENNLTYREISCENITNIFNEMISIAEILNKKHTTIVSIDNDNKTISHKTLKIKEDCVELIKTIDHNALNSVYSVERISYKIKK